MTLKHIEGFDQYQGQSGAALLSALTSAGFTVSNGLAMASGRKAGTFALELQVSAGEAGSSWSSRSNTIRADLHGIAVNSNNRAVAVGDAGTATTSTDNIQWAPLVTGVNKNLKAIKCHANTFIAVGDGGTILRSTDGQAWSIRTPPNATVDLKDVEWGDGKWLAVGALGAAGAVFVSNDDGMTWDNVTENPGARNNLCVKFGGGTWLIGGNTGQLLSSTTGLTWVDRTYGVTNNILKLAYDNGTWIGLAGQGVRRSVNAGVTWAVGASNIIGLGEFRALAVANGRWIIGSSNGLLFMSDDTLAWRQPSFTGGGNRSVYDITATTGSNAGWYMVGARAASGTTATAMLFVSLAPPTIVRRSFTSTATKVVIGFAHRATARGRIFAVEGLFNMDWPSGISILDQLGASVPIRNTWYYYEITIDKTAGTITLHTNDTLDITVALPSAGQAMTTFEMTWEAENGAVARIDDIYLLDSTTDGGATLVDRLKPISVPVRLPTADLAVEWEGSNITAPHWTLVGTLPPTSSNHVASAESGKQDVYTSETALPSGAGSETMPIIAVGLVALAQKSDLDNRQLGLVVGAPGNQKEVIDTTLSITPEYSFAVFEKAPGDVAWDATNVVATPFGIAVRP